MFQTFDAPRKTGAIASRLERLRALMASRKLDALIVPRADLHQGEYVAPCSERLRWLTGFSGSAGLAAITGKSAALLVDGRYTVQARQEVDSALFRILQLPDKHISDWLEGELTRGTVVGFDPWLHTVAEIDQLTDALAPAEIRLRPTSRVRCHARSVAAIVGGVRKRRGH